MGKISKNAQRSGKDTLIHKNCGGVIKMHTIIHRGITKNFAECEKCGVSDRKPSDLM